MRSKPKQQTAKQGNDGFISKIDFDELIHPDGTTAKGITIDTGNDK